MEDNLPETQKISRTSVFHAPPKKRGEIKFFIGGLFFGIVGSSLLALLNFLFLAAANQNFQALVNILVVAGPAIILGLYAYFLARYFRRERSVFWGLLASLLGFIAFLLFLINYSI